MSNNVYAHLIYGFPVMDDDGDDFASEHPPKWLTNKNATEGNDGVTSIEELVAGFENIDAPDEEYDGDNEEIVRKYENYWSAKRSAKERCGVELVYHCRPEYQMWILGVKASHHSEWRGEVGRLGQNIESQTEWRETLRVFCEQMNIPFSEPEWLLAPYSE